MKKAALGERLREERIRKGYTRQELAARAETGAVYLGEIERGLKMPSMNTFIKLIEALEVSADYVLREELSSGREYICDEIAEKLKDLTPQQRRTAADILNAYLQNLD